MNYLRKLGFISLKIINLYPNDTTLQGGRRGGCEELAIAIFSTLQVASTAMVFAIGVDKESFFFFFLFLLFFLTFWICGLGSEDVKLERYGKSGFKSLGISKSGGYFNGKGYQEGGFKTNEGSTLVVLFSSSKTRALSDAFSFWESSKLACKEAIWTLQSVCKVDSELSTKSNAKKSERNRRSSEEASEWEDD